MSRANLAAMSTGPTDAPDPDPQEGVDRWLPPPRASAWHDEPARDEPAVVPEEHDEVCGDAAAPRRRGSRGRRVDVSLWLLALGTVLLVTALVAVVVLVLDDRGTGERGSQAAGIAPRSHALRDPFVVDGARWAVFADSDPNWTRSVLEREAGSGLRWLPVTVRSRNLVRGGFDPRVLQYRMVDGAGREYRPAPKLGTAPLLDEGAQPVPLNKTSQVELAYRVPRSASDFALLFDAGRPGSPQPVKIPLDKG